MSPSLPARVLAGILLASVVSYGARRAGALSSSGMWAALFIGAAAVAAGWSWCLLLLTFFGTSSALSHWRESAKERATQAVVAKGGKRDATQVFANGGVFFAASIGSLLAPAAAWFVVGAGGLAAAAADTWATEIGTAIGGVPRSILRWRPVPPGTSGGISVAGTFALLAGAIFLGVVAWVASRGLSDGPVPGIASAVAGGGVAGAITDTALGAALQERRWCAVCEAATERRVHLCGSPTRVVGGIAGFGNDGVNLTSTVVGSLVSLLLWR